MTNTKFESKRVLVVAYEFPPLAAGGVARSKVFVEHLPNFGWTPIVLTPKWPYGKNNSTPTKDQEPNIIRTLGIDIFSTINFLGRLIRILSKNTRTLPSWLEWRIKRIWQPLCFPDATAGWAIANTFRAIFLVFSRNIDVVYTTSWPYSDHLLGLILSITTKKPWIADFRDPYIRHLNYGTPSKIRDNLNRWFERKICETASIVVTPTELSSEQFKHDYPDLPSSKFITIRNGYDENEFTGNVTKNTKFTVLHSGALYLSRRPDTFLAATEQLAKNRKDFSENIKITFMGVSQDESLDIKQYEKYSFVEVLGWKPRHESIRAIRESSVLLLIRHPECSLTIPGKIYEYMASGNFIFVITGSNDELDLILKDYKNKIILRNPTSEEIYKSLNEIFDLHNNKQIETTPPISVTQFTRQEACKQLAQSLNKLAN